jgi:hypothetical protein
MNASSANTVSQNRRRSASSANFHELHDPVHRPGVADEVADEPSVRVPAERGPAFAPVELEHLRQLADI